MRALVELWHSEHAEKEVSAQVLLRIAKRIDGIELGSGEPTELAKRLGKRLAARRGCVFSEYRIESRPGKNGQLWFLRRRVDEHSTRIEVGG